MWLCSSYEQTREEASRQNQTEHTDKAVGEIEQTMLEEQLNV